MDTLSSTVTIPSFTTEAGVELKDVESAYHVFSQGNPWDNKPIIVVDHALTGSSNIPEWWPEIIGEGKALDPTEYTIVAVTALGSCYGSTFSGSRHPSGGYWGDRFPGISIRDMVRLEELTLTALGIQNFMLIGASLGGARALECAALFPEKVDKALIIATSARSSAWQIGIQSNQIRHIISDPHWNHGNYYATKFTPTAGLREARRLAHLTYRGELELDHRFAAQPQEGENPYGKYYSPHQRFAVESYLDAQAQKFILRFDAGSYVTLTDALNRHDIGRDRGGMDAALQAITVPIALVGVNTDILYPFHQQEHLARNLGNVLWLEQIVSPYGHDAFLIEQEQMTSLVHRFLED